VHRVQYFTACSLDGFVADDHASLEWLYEVPHDASDTSWDEWFPGIGALVMGATTYEWAIGQHQLVDDPSPWRSWYGERPTWVFTHRDLPRIPGVDLTFVSDDLPAVYREVSSQIGDSDIWLVGGGDLAGQFYDADLLHEIHLGITPVFLGGGTPALPRRITSRRLRFRSAELIGQRVRVLLDVQPASEPA
jgi:dihydrofolate reductase